VTIRDERDDAAPRASPAGRGARPAMTSARSLRLPKTRASSDARELAVWTFADVENAEAVRAAVRDGTLECAVLDARAIASLACVELAAYKAALACERGAMVTRAVHSELVFCLSPTRHISEAFRRFGDENTRALIVCKFDATEEDLERVRSVVRGELVAFDERPAVDETALKKWYKVHENELEIGSLADAVLSRIAIRDVA